MKDWVVWHDAYEDAQSALSERRRHVTRLLRDCLDSSTADAIRVLSLCAGDAGDLAGALCDHHAVERVSGVAVELDAVLARRAVHNLGDVGAKIEVVVADAGLVRNIASHLPVDLLLLVGVFGNISDDEVASTIAAVPALCAPGAAIIWTRHRREPDLTPQIRHRFDAIGCDAEAHVSPGPGQFAIGLERLVRPAVPVDLPDRLFRFRD